MAMKVRHMRTSTSSDGAGHFHYIEYIDSSGNGQTKVFISKRTKARHLHKIRNFVVMIADGHTHQLKGSQQKGGGTLMDAAPEMLERRRNQYQLPRGFVDRRKNPSEVVTTLGETGTMSSRRTVRALQNSSDLRANRMRRRGNRERLNPRPMPRPSDKMDDDDSRY